ncbi:S41 family peptidase [Lutibacter flavus]|uniref:N-terminal domain of Peptidase_S41 n=1 Tax=Lutibacter flavus TaxID=691689 RepID=A0A238XCU9_9FLAO|nr:S41 family peptidase [Lutibacter flavus]SNR56401.1 N-terminal domain of Peptidase_S41 [Lutibacter flavus]
MKKVYLVIVLTFFIGQIFGQRMRMKSEPIEPKSIELNEIHKMVKDLADSIAVNYIIGEKAPMLKKNLLKELRKGNLDHFKEKNALANHLSNILVTWSNDKHFRIMVSEPAGERLVMPSSYEHIAKDNYSFKKMEHLNGNIAYIKFNRFIPPAYSGSLITSAMLFAANSDAVIIDLRDNIGGSPDTVAMLAGFFLKEPTLLTVNYIRATDTKEETWSTIADVRVNSSNPDNFIVPTATLERLKNVPLYILTGRYTFSAAEMFSSSLQGYKRAKIVGVNTLGGGHGISPIEMAQGFTAFIPFTCYYHPVTKKSWEAVGVKPDIPCTAADAKRVAQISILKELQKKPKHDSKIPVYLKELETESPK